MDEALIDERVAEGNPPGVAALEARVGDPAPGDGLQGGVVEEGTIRTATAPAGAVPLTVTRRQVSVGVAASAAGEETKEMSPLAASSHSRLSAAKLLAWMGSVEEFRTWMAPSQD
jgi:hypothetical protein